MLQGFNIKNEKPNSNINIYKISHLPFDMLCDSLKIMMVWCKMYWQSASRSKKTCGSEPRA